MGFPIYFTLLYKNTSFSLAEMKKRILKQKTEVKTHPEQEKKQLSSRPWYIFKNAVSQLQLDNKKPSVFCFPLMNICWGV